MLPDASVIFSVERYSKPVKQSLNFLLLAQEMTSSTELKITEPLKLQGLVICGVGVGVGVGDEEGTGVFLRPPISANKPPQTLELVGVGVGVGVGVDGGVVVGVGVIKQSNMALKSNESHGSVVVVVVTQVPE